MSGISIAAWRGFEVISQVEAIKVCLPVTTSRGSIYKFEEKGEPSAQITIPKEFGIRNDPYDWAKEVGNPRYILDLLPIIINVSMQTVEVVEGLPEVRWE